MLLARRLRQLLTLLTVLVLVLPPVLLTEPADVTAHDPLPGERIRPAELSAVDQETGLPSQIVDPGETVLGGYHTVEAVYGLLDAWQSAAPTLAEGFTYGVSWDKQTPGGPAGYDLRGITITNRLRTGPKPAFILLAAMHPRELVTTEIALRFVEYLLTRYGEDPDVTWLLDEHQVVVFPMINPDGRKDAEQGVLQRKNKNTVGGPCPTDPPTYAAQPGVDLNRNFGFRWETGNGSPGDPCAQTFGGLAPDSEPEVVALENWLREIFRTRRGPGDHDPAPDTTEGIVISLHAYSNLVLWPWGYTEDPAPNGADLAGLGSKLATYNGYQPMKITDLYRASGATDDWVYGTFGVPMFTFEIGPNDRRSICNGFMPAYQCLDGEPDGNFWGLNLPALLYAAKVARAPYLLHRGPDTLDVTASETPDGYLVQALIDDTNNGFEAIAAAEMYLDAPPWRGGTPVPLLPTDGAFDSSVEDTAGTFDRPVPSGWHLVYVRGQDTPGNWGPVSAVWLFVGR